MNIKTLFNGIGLVLFLAIFSVNTFAAPPCKGPNKNDPGCPGAEPPPATAVVDSATVDWLNHKITVRGSGLSTASIFFLGGTELDPSPAVIMDNELEIPFNQDVAAEVNARGSYLLNVDGTDVLTIFIKSQIVDPFTPLGSGCPCDPTWANALNTHEPGLWSANGSECVEIIGAGSNDYADISGTVLTDPHNPLVDPQFPIGASFISGDPINSVCRLTQVNPDLSTSDLVNLRINENQQTDCADLLKLNVCDTVLP